VLGGGFIQSADAESRHAGGLVRPQRVAEPLRG
jgi:tRNA-specific 2-thiouridylase